MLAPRKVTTWSQNMLQFSTKTTTSLTNNTNAFFAVLLNNVPNFLSGQYDFPLK